MIGLQSGCVTLFAAHDSWVSNYRQAAAEILAFVPQLAAVEHIGSTAVEGLLAKPIVDIAVGYRDESSVSQLIDGLTTLGYRYRGNRADAGGHIADFIDSGLTCRHVHIVAYDSAQWKRYLVFRDKLRRSSAARSQYIALKRELAIRYPENRRAYTAAKVHYIEGFTDRILAEE